MHTTNFIDIERMQKCLCQVRTSDYAAEDIDRVDPKVAQKYPIGKEWTEYERHLSPDGQWDRYEVVLRVEGYRHTETDNMATDHPVVREISRVTLRRILPNK